MTGPLQNIGMFCITIEHRAVATIFLNTLQKYYQLPILGILNMSLREKCPNTELFLVRIFLYLDATCLAAFFKKDTTNL